jgi:hypothetical protein
VEPTNRARVYCDAFTKLTSRAYVSATRLKAAVQPDLVLRRVWKQPMKVLVLARRREDLNEDTAKKSREVEIGLQLCSRLQSAAIVIRLITSLTINRDLVKNTVPSCWNCMQMCGLIHQNSVRIFHKNLHHAIENFMIDYVKLLYFLRKKEESCPACPRAL